MSPLALSPLLVVYCNGNAFLCHFYSFCKSLRSYSNVRTFYERDLFRDFSRDFFRDFLQRSLQRFLQRFLQRLLQRSLQRFLQRSLQRFLQRFLQRLLQRFLQKISPEISSEISPEISSETSPEISSETSPEISSEISPDIFSVKGAEDFHSVEGMQVAEPLIRRHSVEEKSFQLIENVEFQTCLEFPFLPLEPTFSISVKFTPDVPAPGKLRRVPRVTESLCSWSCSASCTSDVSDDA